MGRFSSRKGKEASHIEEAPRKSGNQPPEELMLHNRIFEPKEGENLYHYCDGNAFAAICDSRKIRLNDLFTMNDFMELHWGYHIWELAAGEMLEEVGKDFLDKIDEIVSESGFHLLLVGSCFSLDGDVLSQWRAYSNDGSGYAIGFDAKLFPDLPVRPLRVLYDKTQQIEEAKLFIRSIHHVENEEKVKFGEDFFTACATFACDLAAFKNPAFAEEKEVRIVHVLDFERSNKTLKLVDHGGIAFDQDVPGEVVKFRMKNDIPVAYIDIDFMNDGKMNPIKEVVLGPRNEALLMGISVYLETLGIGDVKIRKSKASYR